MRITEFVRNLEQREVIALNAQQLKYAMHTHGINRMYSLPYCVIILSCVLLFSVLFLFSILTFLSSFVQILASFSFFFSPSFSIFNLYSSSLLIATFFECILVRYLGLVRAAAKVCSSPTPPRSV